MIRVITKCLGISKLKEYKWDNHFAFMHFGSCKNVYDIEGKQLKWWKILKNGDIIEKIETPKDPISIGISILSASMLASLTTSIGVTGMLTVAGIVGGLAIAGGVALVGFAVSAVLGAGNSTSGATTSKTYSSTSQAEITGASNDISTGILPVVCGEIQQAPSYSQYPYRLVGDGNSTNKYNCYYTPNYKNCVYYDYKLGESSINNYSVDFLDITNVSGSTTFIGFDNCKAVDINEQLSYDSEGSVEQNASFIYNEVTTSESIQIDFVLRFSNVDLANWGNKSFNLDIEIKDDLSATQHLTQAFTVVSGDLVFVSAGVYTYAGTKTFTQAITELISTTFSPTANTRANSVENTNELNSLYVSQIITMDSFNPTTVLNQSINKYLGTTSEVIQTSPKNTTEIDIIIAFQGLYKLNSDSTRSPRSVNLEIMYKVNGGDYLPISSANALYIRDLNGVKQPLSTSTTIVSGSKVTVSSPANIDLADQLFFRPIGFELPAGQYIVRVRSADFADKTNLDVGYPTCAEMQFRVHGDVLDNNILSRVNQIKLVATAYKGLSGDIKKFNYKVAARIPNWNGTNWNTIEETKNPASIIRYLLTDTNANPRAEDPYFIDNDSLVEMWQWCENEGYTASFIKIDSIKIGDVINDILTNCQCARAMYFGKHTFIIDTQTKAPVGLFNQHNSFDFKNAINLGRQTTAIRASFINNEDYKPDEVTIYWYNNQTNETIEAGKTDDDYDIIKTEINYCTDKISIIKSLKYRLYALQSRRRNFELGVNLEAINLKLLDRIYISDTTNMQNESSGLIKSLVLSAGNLIGFKLYSEIDIPTGAKIIIRSLDYNNEIKVINIYDVLNNGNSDTINIEPIVYNGIIQGQGNIKGLSDTWWYDGDLFTLGQDTIYDCSITDIKYNEDLTATITAREY